MCLSEVSTVECIVEMTGRHYVDTNVSGVSWFVTWGEASDWVELCVMVHTL